MIQHRIPKTAFLNSAFVVSLALAGAFALSTDALAAKSHAAAKKAEPAKPAGEVVDYPELENRVGQTVVIDTTFKTTRQGRLIKYTQPALTIDVGRDDQPIEFTVPRETIKTITVLGPSAEPVTDTGTSGAKKN